MKAPKAERLARLVKLGTGLVVGAAAIAVFCRGAAPPGAAGHIAPASSVLPASSRSTVPESAPQNSPPGLLTRVNLNTATAGELLMLDGIGTVKAEAIIAYREEHGAFSDISEIMNVSGIGKTTFENIRGQITV